MLGAGIDVIQPQIRNVIAYLLPLLDKKPTTAVVKQDKTSKINEIKRADWTETIIKMLVFAAHTSYQTGFNKGSIKYCLLLLWVRLKISYASHYVVYEIMSVCIWVKQQTDDLFNHM